MTGLYRKQRINILVNLQHSLLIGNSRGEGQIGCSLIIRVPGSPSEDPACHIAGTKRPTEEFREGA